MRVGILAFMVLLPPSPWFVDLRILKELTTKMMEVRILMDLKWLVFMVLTNGLEVRILKGLKSFVSRTSEGAWKCGF
jgi:hypothetical protein